MKMKLAVVISLLCALSVQGLPNQNAFPKGLTSFKPEQVLSYVKKLAMETRQNTDVENRNNSMHCYHECSSALQELGTKSKEGNQKCNATLSVAESEAQSLLDSNREILDRDSKNIQDSLEDCRAGNKTANEALDCYETQGQQNINPISSLSSRSRTFKSNYTNAISIAKSSSDKCSYDVSTKSESISARIYNNLNRCIATGIWQRVEIPDFDTSDPTIPTTSTELPKVTETTANPTPEQQETTSTELPKATETTANPTPEQQETTKIPEEKPE